MTPALVNTPVLETERLILRAPDPQDWPVFADFFGSDRSRFIGGPKDRKDAWRSFGHVIGMWVLRGFGSFVFTLRGDDTALGMTGPWYPEGWPERELGWTVWTPRAEGKGYAFEASKAARDHLFRDLGWDTAVSYIDPDNARSIALAERLGAVLDPNAATPDKDDEACLVYRHPKPEARA